MLEPHLLICTAQFFDNNQLILTQISCDPNYFLEPHDAVEKYKSNFIKTKGNLLSK